MKNYAKPDHWQCLPTALAMVIEVPPNDIMDIIGHGGSEITHPDLPEPQCRRGFHPQELIEAALCLGWAMIQIEYNPQHAPIEGVEPKSVSPDASWRFHLHIEASRGVLAAYKNNKGHAFAYDHGMLYDPDQRTPPFKIKDSTYTHTVLWRLERIAPNV